MTYLKARMGPRQLHSLGRYYTCPWCDFPMPDCVCCISKRVANDNENTERNISHAP